MRPRRIEEQDRRHGWGVLAAVSGPIAWSVHFLFVYLLVEMACQTGVLSGVVLGLTGLAWVNLAATVVALAVVIWAGVSAFRAWRGRRAQTGDPGRGRRSHETTRIVRSPEGLLALAGWALSLLFGTLILLTAVPMLVLAPCPWM